MKKLLLVLLFFCSLAATAGELYIRTFGKPADPAILFLHGGPGYNAAGFEITSADALAKRGFFVIVYDRRGEGRSADMPADFTFDQTFADINAICDKFTLKKVTLMGHSFGGIVATLYAQKFPEKVNAVVLVSVPVALQETFSTIIARSRKIYSDKQDTSSLGYLDVLEKMDHSSIQYASFSFMNAMKNGFYSPKNMTAEAAQLLAKAKSDPAGSYLSKMTMEAPQGFWKNEHYTSIDLTENIKNLVSARMKIFGIYGKDDGLYSEGQVNALADLIGKSNVVYLDDASHNVFIDRQDAFLQAVTSYLK